MKFKNNKTHDVYINLGRLQRITAGQVIDLPGAIKCDPLTPLYEHPAEPPKKKKVLKKKTAQSPKNVTTSGTI